MMKPVFVPTMCAECVVRVDAGDGPDDSYVQMMLLTGHHAGFRQRLKRAWWALLGQERDWLEFMDANTTDDLIVALLAARGAAFGPRPHRTVTASTATVVQVA